MSTVQIQRCCLCCVFTSTGKPARINLIKIKLLLAGICFSFLGFPPGKKQSSVKKHLVCHTHLCGAPCNTALLFSRGIPTCAIMNVMQVPKSWLILQN